MSHHVTLAVTVCPLPYLVRWTGYEGTDQETDWLSALELTHAKELVQDFHTAYPHKPRPLNSLNTKENKFLLVYIL